MKMKYLIFTFSILALFFLGNKAYAYDNHDFQIWNTDTEEIKINKSLKAVFEQEFRWGDNASELFYQHYDVGVVYAVNKNLDLGAGYRHVLDKKGDKFKSENEPNISAILKTDFAGFSLSDRNRLEYRHFKYQTDNWRYRNLFTLRLPWKFTKLQIRPYLADEIFINLNGMDLNGNRLYFGLGFDLIGNLKGELYYMLHTVKASNICTWSDTNVFGTKLKYSF